MPNSTKWIHCANNLSFCPILPGDTRITVIEVPPLPSGTEIDKFKLMPALKDEGPAGLYSLFYLELPLVIGRLRIPVLETETKKETMCSNRLELDVFIEEEMFEVGGHIVSVQEFYARFNEWLPPERRSYWTRQRMTRSMPSTIVKGR